MTYWRSVQNDNFHMFSTKLRFVKGFQGIHLAFVVFVFLFQFFESFSVGDGGNPSHPVLNEPALEVVEFVLKGPRQEVLSLFSELVALKVGSRYRALFVPFYLCVDSRQ